MRKGTNADKQLSKKEIQKKSTIRLVGPNITAEPNPAPPMKSNVAAADTCFPTPTVGKHHPQIFLGRMNHVGVKMCVI